MVRKTFTSTRRKPSLQEGNCKPKGDYLRAMKKVAHQAPFYQQVGQQPAHKTPSVRECVSQAFRHFATCLSICWIQLPKEPAIEKKFLTTKIDPRINSKSPL